MIRNLRTLGFVLSVLALFSGLWLFGDNNDLTTTGGVAIVVVAVTGLLALAAAFFWDGVSTLARFAGAGLVAITAATFFLGGFGTLVKPNFVALANAEQARAEGRYTDSAVIENCEIKGSRPKGLEFRTDGFVCVVDIDQENNAVVAHLREGLNLNNTETVRSKDLRNLTLTFPAEGRADIYLFNVTSGLPGQSLPQEVMDDKGAGYYFDANATHYTIDSFNS